MSTNTCTPAEHDLILEQYAHSLSTVYLYLMVPTILGSLLLPFLVALFYLSNARQRRTPIFILVALAVILGLAQSIQQATIHMRMLYNPVDTTRKVFTHPIIVSTLLLELLPNWVADLALLYRILAVYPRSTTPPLRFALIFTPPIIFKAVRVACWIGFCVALTRPGGQPPHFLWTKEERLWTVVERLFTALDNTYATAFFLWKLRGVVHFKDDLGRVSSTGTPNSFGSRVRALFWLSVTNFVLPVPLCFLQVGFAAALPNSIVYEVVQHFINFISVVCVAFATVWYSSATLRYTVKQGPTKPGTGPSTLRFRRSHSESPRSSADSELGAPRSAAIKKPHSEKPVQVKVDWTRQSTV